MATPAIRPPSKPKMTCMQGHPDECSGSTDAACYPECPAPGPLTSVGPLAISQAMFGLPDAIAIWLKMAYPVMAMMSSNEAAMTIVEGMPADREAQARIAQLGVREPLTITTAHARWWLTLIPAPPCFLEVEHLWNHEAGADCLKDEAHCEAQQEGHVEQHYRQGPRAPQGEPA